MPIRLFVALRPPPAIRRGLLAMTGGVPAARWQDDDQLHLTLRFVGAVEHAAAEDLAAALAQVHAAAPVVALAGVGRFERNGRTDTLWAGVAPAEPLRHLRHKVEQACIRAGQPAERRAFLPHITLARLPRAAAIEAEVAGWLRDHAALASAPFALGHLVLYESILARAGARYEPAMRWPLRVA